MKKLIEIKKKLANDWFKFLQKEMVNQFQLLENGVGKKKKKNIFLNNNGKKKIKKKAEVFHVF